MTSALAALGIDERAVELYRAVLKHPGHRAADLAEQLGWSADEVDDSLRALLKVRLVHHTPNGVVADPPEAAIEGLLTREERRISLLYDQLNDVRAAIPTFSEEHRAGELDRHTPLPLDVVVGNEVGTVVEDLVRRTSGEILILQPTVQPGIGNRSGLRDVIVPQLREGRSLRTVYPASALEHPESVEYVRFWQHAGEAARLASSVPARVFVFGSEIALIPAEWGSSPGSQLVVRTPALVAALQAYVDAVWTHSVSLPPQSRVGVADAERRHLLEMLAMGMKDEALARHLDISLRTVRRRVADVLGELGVSTRFQAGMEAVRRGWL